MKSKGFTLVEVLIASTILFSVLALSSFAFKSLRQNSQQAERTILLNSPVRSLMLSIQQELRVTAPEQMQGQGEIQGIQYQWSASSEPLMATPEVFDVDAQAFTQSQPRIRMYNVALTLRLVNKEKVYKYKELAWLR
jgi:prepilin-type N-terminal cleavage/methylation domain-containing protein